MRDSETFETLFSRSLNVFIVAAETRKFSETARRLGVTQSSISQTISALEKKLGFTLFVRESRPLQPTPEAIELYNGIKKSDEEIRSILQKIRLRNWVRPTVRFGLIETVGSLIVSDIFKDLKGSIGSVSLSTGSSGSMFQSVLSGELDLAVVAGDEHDEEIKKVFLYEDPWFVITPPTIAVPPNGFSWSALSLLGIPLIYHSKDTADGRILQRFFSEKGLLYPKVFEAESNALIYSMVSNGLGWSLTHLFGLLGSKSNMDSLGISPCPSDLPSRKIYLIAKKNYSEEIFEVVRTSIMTAVGKTLMRRSKEPAFSSLFN